MPTVGPGAIAPDGSPVELYRLLPVGDEVDVVRKILPVKSSLLELGAGAGRVTKPLAAEGYSVTAVDQSSEMLAHISYARTVHANIEDLNLEEKYDGVLLMSNLITSPAFGRRVALLRACARHLRPGGVAIFEQPPKNFFDDPRPVRVDTGSFTMEFRNVSKSLDGVVSGTLTHTAAGLTWSESVDSKQFDFDELRHANLRLLRVLDSDRRWFVAHRRGE